MTLVLTRGENNRNVLLRIPATSADIKAAYVQLDEVDEMLPTRIVDVAESPVRNLAQYLRKAQPDEPGVLDELNRLSQRISDMSAQEQKIFMGALDGASINGLADVLRISEQTDQYFFIPHVNSDIELGRYVAVSYRLNGDPRFPEEAWPYLDFAKIGAEFYANHDGTYIYEGYVFRKDSGSQQASPKPQQNGDREAIVNLSLRGPRGEYLLTLPAEKQCLEDVRAYMGVDDFSETTVQSVGFHPSLPAELIPTECVCVEDANELALCIEGMREQDGELLKYLSVLSVCQPETMKEALCLALKLDDYERVPDEAEEYGKSVLRRIGADDEIIDTIDGYMDFASLGEASMEEDGVRRTEFGLVRRCSCPFPEKSPGMRMGI